MLAESSTQLAAPDPGYRPGPRDTLMHALARAVEKHDAAINKLDAIWASINTAYRGEYLRHQVADSGARLAIYDSHYLEGFLEIQKQLPTALRGTALHRVPQRAHQKSDRTSIEIPTPPGRCHTDDMGRRIDGYQSPS